MARVASLLLLGLVSAGWALAQPVINGIQNNYSYMLAGSPNFGIAQGCIFVLYGANMAPATLMTQGFDPTLERNLGGVSIKTTVAGTTTEAIPYYVSATQLAAILPSSTPVGAGTMTVTYNGQTSPPFAVTVVKSAFGILTLGGNGLGTAAVYDLDYQYINFTNSANPGQSVIFWGTGQGPDPNDETALIAAPQSLSDVPFEFYIGNKPANVVYHGRSAYPGLDQIIVQIPQGVSGCYAAAYAKTGNIISNFVSIPIAPSGRVCEDWYASAAEGQDLLGTGRTEINAGWYYLGRFSLHTPAASGQPAMTVIQDSATAQFTRSTPFHSSNWGAVGGFANPGCLVTVWPVSNPFTAPFVKTLDAGPAVTLTLPDGTTRTLPQQNVGFYPYSQLSINPGDKLFIPETAGGSFRFNAPGGADVGPSEATLAATPALVWDQWTSISGVSRSQPLTVTWQGGAPGSFVLIQGISFTADYTLVTTFGCTEHAEAGTFTVPRDILASMVRSGRPAASANPLGQLLVSNYSFPTRFKADRIDHGSVSFFRWFQTVVGFE